jgi:putative MATE family efflux protein
MIGPFIDMIWIGRLGAASVAGAGIAASTVTLANGAMGGLAWGVRAVVARYIGAGDREEANHAVRQAFVICAVYAVVVAVIGILLAESILRTFGLNADVIAQGAAYMRIQLAGMITMSLRMLTEGTMQAAGDALTPMRIGLIFRAVHLVLCPLLVFGLGPFPSMGVSGAAVTNVISQGIGGGLGLWVLLTGRTRLKLTLNNLRLDLKMMNRIVKVALPNLFTHIQHHLCVLVLTWIVAPFGTLAVAAHTIWQRIDTIPTTMAAGVGSSAGVLGAQNLGAKQPERAEKSAWLAAGLALCIMMLIWAKGLASIFTNDPELVKTTSLFLKIGAASYLGIALNLVFLQFLINVGDTVMGFLLETLPSWGIQIALSFILSRYTNLGIYGVRWSIVLGFIIAGVIFLLYFRMGKWKLKNI